MLKSDSTPAVRDDAQIDDGVEDEAVHSDLEQEVPGIERYDMAFTAPTFRSMPSTSDCRLPMTKRKVTFSYPTFSVVMSGQRNKRIDSSSHFC